MFFSSHFPLRCPHYPWTPWTVLWYPGFIWGRLHPKIPARMQITLSVWKRASVWVLLVVQIVRTKPPQYLVPPNFFFFFFFLGWEKRRETSVWNQGPPPLPEEKNSIKIRLFTNSNWISRPFVFLRNRLLTKLISFPKLLNALRLRSAEVPSFVDVLITFSNIH